MGYVSRMRTFSPYFTSLVLVAISAVACGDDDGSGGAGASPSDGGSGGGDGGSTSTMLVGGSTSTMQMGDINVGEPCMQDTDCADGLCFVEDSTGWPKGYCTAACDGDFDCYGGTCLVDLQQPFCAFPCGTPDDCRPGYACETVGANATSDVCVPGCTDDDQCTSPQECIIDEADPNLGLCIEDEQCHDGEDNDLDDAVDCGDTNCLVDAECAADIDAACGDADTLMASQNGDNTNGTSLFTADCGFLTGMGKEVLYTIETPARGELTVSADPAAGDLGLYIRSSCDDPTTQAICVDSGDPAATEVAKVGAVGGETWTIFVDAYQPASEGAFTLTHTFTPAICGDNIITLPETCDDMNPTAGDGCSDLCEIEFDFYCEAAEVITLGTTTGTTTTGTSLFTAPQDADECVDGAGIGGREKLYLYTPAADGMLTIAVEPTSDFDTGIYVRTDCADPETQIGCSDTVFQGVQDESLTVAVTNGVPITIYVDSFQTQAGPSNGGTFEITLTQP